MPALLQRVRRFVREHDLWRPDTRVVCAVSGGSDSVALAHLLSNLATAGEVQFVGLVHLNHQLRPTADRDEQYCARLAERLERPLFADRVDVRARAERERRSIEHAGHEARYALFARARSHFDADVIALAHTQDDQAETFLLRLLRGAGPRGLASMHPRHGDVIRPLLDCRREELQRFLVARGVEFVDDETNRDLTVPRNRVRATLLPLLASQFNPNIVEVLAREASLARDISHWLESEAATLGPDLDVDTLRQAPLPVGRLALWRAMTDAAGARPVTFDHVDAALGLLNAPDGTSFDAPGHRVQRIGSRLVLTSRGTTGARRGSRGSKGSGGSGGSGGSKGARESNPSNPSNRSNPLNSLNHFAYPLSIPGEVIDTQRGFTVSAESSEEQRGGAAGANLGMGQTAAIRRDLVGSALVVRNRRPGDRFRPVGLGGRKKLQDFFVDRKIARAARDSVPIVVDEHDRIVWVAGYGIDEAFRVTDASQAVLLLKLRYLEACS